jgi:catechol 2,3-dioxygenase-like lactoylglutathione lyase family enzyme
LLSYVTIGANDLTRSERFYSAVLEPLGYEKAIRPTGIAYALPGFPDRYNGPGAVYVTKPYDGKEATVGNGTMLAFRAPTDGQVRDVHAAGLAAGGADEGSPGFRAEYSKNFYVAYMRDPVGNKLAIFCTVPQE